MNAGHCEIDSAGSKRYSNERLASNLFFKPTEGAFDVASIREYLDSQPDVVEDPHGTAYYLVCGMPEAVQNRWEARKADPSRFPRASLIEGTPNQITLVQESADDDELRSALEFARWMWSHFSFTVQDTYGRDVTEQVVATPRLVIAAPGLVVATPRLVIAAPGLAGALPWLSAALPRPAAALPRPAAALPGLSAALPWLAKALPGLSAALPWLAPALPWLAKALPWLAKALPGLAAVLPGLAPALPWRPCARPGLACALP